MAASSSSSSRLWKYDVFLSFRGEDTRGGFTDHLYEAFVQNGIHTFKDDDEMEEGTNIYSELFAAIEASRMAVVVISEHYASSRWCLAELVKILECREHMGMKVMPIFYKVDLSDVRNQRGSFGKAFLKHEARFGEDDSKVLQWRKALFEIAGLKAWASDNRTLESKLKEDICEAILRRIKPNLTLIEKEKVVGVTSKLNHLFSLLNPNSNDDDDDDDEDNNVILVGIHGMGGIGKSTIARVCYEQIRGEFKAHCFISNVREQFETAGITHLQSKLLSGITFSMKKIDKGDDLDGRALISKAISLKKTLLVLDDVDHLDQITKLIPDKDCFVDGSRVIITTRNADLLSTHGVKRMFKMEELEYEESLQLLSLNAFKERCPREGYLGQSDRIVKLAGGHPLALQVLGSSLQNKDLSVWDYVIERLKGGWSIDDKIFKCLKVSYDGLDDEQKEIFLDIACFFKGKRRDLVEEILDGCDLYAKRNVELLIQKSLITLSHPDRLQMHDLLQEMGRKVVHQKPVRDRLWCLNNIKSVVTEASIQSIFLKSTGKIVLIPLSLSRMHQLRLLNFHNVRLQDQSECCIPSELRYLKWKRYPFEFLPLNSEVDYNLIQLHMCYSNLKQLWHGEKNLEKLKYIKVGHSQKLFKTPNFTQLPNLERLDLEGCTNLSNIHPSIFIAKKLTFLSMKDCINITNLPLQITIHNLEVFILSGCSKLKKLPEFIGNTDSLLELRLDGTSIAELPSSVASLNRLTVLNLMNCKKLVSVTFSFNRLSSLESLNLCGCSKLGNRTRTLDGGAQRVTIKWLVLSLYRAPRSGVFGIPSMSGIYSLTELNLSNCNIETIPEGIEGLVWLRMLNLSNNSFTELPASLAQLHNLRSLNMNGCKKLVQVPELPARIMKLKMKDCISLKTSTAISKMDRLYFMTEVNLLNCYQLADDKHIQTLLTSWMQKTAFQTEKLSIMIPGSEIPDWFTTTKMGSSISMKWDPNARNGNKICFALCVVFGPTHPQNITTVVSFAISASMIIEKELDGSAREEDEACGHVFLGSGMETVDHVWMFVLPCTESYLEIEFRFGLRVNPSHSIPSMGLKKCGVRLINMEEDEAAVAWKGNFILLKNSFRLWQKLTVMKKRGHCRRL
ncbi:TMV resistance protein N-like isoform X2 [Cucurbita pepo subsp. pepo]|uniref:TMV resistance protein N-like isoform X2 n=1 Tax=Cucurbita pepo subsp. pepo TaxID=3664 RepID=UPI000C9D50CC|nr:TMV resistance protein N-like isoform X2 [Cucurbita pepo subsp. pepo]